MFTIQLFRMRLALSFRELSPAYLCFRDGGENLPETVVDFFAHLLSRSEVCIFPVLIKVLKTETAIAFERNENCIMRFFADEEFGIRPKNFSGVIFLVSR